MSDSIAAKVLVFYGGDASRWTKVCFARARNGRECAHDDARAACWCLSGAAWRLDIDWNELAHAIGFRAEEFASPALAMEAWNDAPERTFAEVEARLRAAAEARHG